MKTNSKIDPASDLNDELRPEYTAADFKKRLPNKFAARFSDETHMVVLDSDVAEAFATAEAVNAALRSLLPQSRAALPVDDAPLDDAPPVSATAAGA